LVCIVVCAIVGKLNNKNKALVIYLKDI